MNRLFSCVLKLDRKRLVDEKYRYFIQFEMFSLILGIISCLMGVVNLFADGWFLASLDIAFSAVCLVDYFILRATEKVCVGNYVLFSGILMIFLSFLLITGGTAGYGSYWILILPVCVTNLLGLWRGAVLSGLMFVISAVIFWVQPVRALCQCAYSDQYCIVFLLLYTTFFLLGCCMEVLRLMCYKEMLNVQKVFQNAAEKDALTGIANRIWFNQYFIDQYNGKPAPTSSVVFLIDIDDFKEINDTYGHLAGDEILCRSVDTIRKYIGDNVLCRWGGEEFFAYIPSRDREQAKALLEKIRRSVEEISYRYKEYNDIRITVSIGSVYIEKNTIIDVEKVLYEVDRQLYQSKAQGKNRVNFNGFDGRKRSEK